MGWGADVPIGSFCENSSWRLFGPWATVGGHSGGGRPWSKEGAGQGCCRALGGEGRDQSPLGPRWFPPGPQGWMGSRLRSPPSPAQPAPGKPGAAAPLPALPPRAGPPARPGTVLQGLPAQSPSEPAREVGLGDGGSSRCPRADPADASCGHFSYSHHRAPLGRDKYPRQLGASAGGPRVHRGPSTEASAEKGKQSGSASSPCQRWHAGDPSGVGEGAVLCRSRPDGLQAALEPSAWRMPCPSQPRVPVPLTKAHLSSEPRTCSLEGSGGGRGVARFLLS